MNKFLLTFLLVMTFALVNAQDHVIEVSNNIYTPSSLTITQGETVQWVNVEGFHNVNGDLATYANNPEGFANGAASLMPWTFDHTFTIPGTYDYQCDPHVALGMVGTITVEAASISADMVISGVFDSQPMNVGAKGIEFYVLNDIADLSNYGVGSANNGGGTDGEEYTFPAISATAGECLYLAVDSTLFNEFFGFFPQFTDGSAPNINGDDAIELFEFGQVIDVFGDIDIDASGTLWDHVDGWVYRLSGTPPNMGTFDPSTFVYSGINALEDIPTNNDAMVPFPVCSYSPIASTVMELMDDNETTNQNVPIAINVLANDFLPNETTAINILSASLNAEIIVNSDFTITYNPNTDYCGEDGFVYEVCDNTSFCSNAVVSVTVVCPTTYTVSTIGAATMIDGDGVLTTLGEGVELTGTVYGIDLQPDNLIQFTIIDQSGGLGLFSTETFGYTVAEGDEITVLGIMDQFNGLAQISPDTIIFNSAGNPLNEPTVVTALGEATESELVTFAEAVTIDPAEWLGDGSAFNVIANNGETIRIDEQTDLSNMATLPSYTFFVTGIGGQFDNASPFDSGYQLFPRYAADLDFDVVDVKEAVWADEITIFPNPAKDVLNISTTLQFDEIRVTNVIGEDLILLQNETEVNIKALQAGAYFITFKKGDELVTKRFMK